MDNRDMQLEKIRQLFEQVIKTGVKSEMEKNDNDPVFSDDEMIERGYSLPPENMYDKVIAVCKKDENTNKKTHNLKRWKKIILIAAIIGTTIIGALNVNAVKMCFLRTISYLTQDSIKLKRTNIQETDSQEVNEDEAYLKIEKVLGVMIKRPNYLPEGVVLKSVNIVDDSLVRLKYADNNGILLLIDVEVATEFEESGGSIDTTEGETAIELINDKQVLISCFERDNSENWVNATWNDNTTVYDVTTNLNIEVLKQVIENWES